LSRLAELLEGRTARILIVQSIAQQAASMEPTACLPSLLQHLGNHSLELAVFPRYDSRTETMKAAWIKLLQTRGMEYKLKEEAQGDAWVLIVNP
ncbi:hypothetical protein ACT3OH_15520, partial [Vreelandella zhanjiangensis]|uniref:hypothetical protein n=1 Tax=Vreelandella zhanjiangensis TaxID=1121960 RepID=UPI00402AD3FB